MKTHGVSHIAIGVRDMERSLAFYRDTLGFEVVRDEIPGRERGVAGEELIESRAE